MISTQTFTDVVDSYIAEHAPHNAAAYRSGLDTQIIYGNGRQFRLFQEDGTPATYEAPSQGEWERAGCSGYNPRRREAIYATLEFDSNHGGVQITPQERQEILDRLSPYCDLLPSTGGEGIHARIWFTDPIPCHSRREYSRICEAAIQVVQERSGFHFRDKVESRGCILWLASASQAPGAFEGRHEFPGLYKIPSESVVARIEAAPHRDTPQVVLNKNHRDILEALERNGCNLGVGYFSDGTEYIKSHTSRIAPVADALGMPFQTASPGTELDKPNCYYLPGGNGVLVFRMGDGQEPTWSKRASDQKSFCVLSLPIVCDNDFFTNVLSNLSDVAESPPLTLREIVPQIEQLGINRIGDQLFVQVGDCIRWLKTTDDLFSFFNWKLQRVLWGRGSLCVGKGELLSHLQATAPKYDSIANYPHYPLIPGLYYACDTRPPDNYTGALDRFIDFFCPKTAEDRELIKSILLTMVFGHETDRTNFVITAEGIHCQEYGKDTLVKYITQLFGGYISATGTLGDIKTRILSPQAEGLRAILIGNATGVTTNPEVAAMMTEQTISGRKLHVGEGRQKNVFTWFITGNNVRLDRDLAQRVAIIYLEEPVKERTWEPRIQAFIKEYTNDIIGDCLYLLAGPKQPLINHSRRAVWDAEVLGCLENPDNLLALINERAKAHSVENQEADNLEELICETLEQMGYERNGSYWFPNSVARDFYNLANGTSYSQTRVTREINALSQLGNSRLSYFRHSDGRGFLFAGQGETVRLSDSDFQFNNQRSR